MSNKGFINQFKNTRRQSRGDQRRMVIRKMERLRRQADSKAQTDPSGGKRKSK